MRRACDLRTIYLSEGEISNLTVEIPGELKLSNPVPPPDCRVVADSYMSVRTEERSGWPARASDWRFVRLHIRRPVPWRMGRWSQGNWGQLCPCCDAVAIASRGSDIYGPCVHLFRVRCARRARTRNLG